MVNRNTFNIFCLLDIFVVVYIDGHAVGMRKNEKQQCWQCVASTTWHLNLQEWLCGPLCPHSCPHTGRCVFTLVYALSTGPHPCLITILDVLTLVHPLSSGPHPCLTTILDDLTLVHPLSSGPHRYLLLLSMGIVWILAETRDFLYYYAKMFVAISAL